jgi:hypothetical protein
VSVRSFLPGNHNQSLFIPSHILISQGSSSSLKRKERRAAHDTTRQDKITATNCAKKENIPVGQPLLVILLLGGLEGLEGTVGGVDEAEEVGEELAGKVEENHQEDEGSGTEGQVGLGDTSGSLKLDQLGDLVQLLVELSNVVAG